MGIYQELGVKTLINAGGHFTVTGGSLMSKAVINAMNEAAQNFVEMSNLLTRAGEIIAETIGAEAAVVTSGAAAGIALATAACLTGKDRWKMMQLPHTEKFEKNEVLLQRVHYIPYANMFQVPGAKIVDIGGIMSTEPWELEGAISEKTAAIAHVASALCRKRAELPLEQVVKIAKAHNVPVILDAAAETPPFSNLKKWLDMGADLVISSGGKAIEGPNDTGLVFGRKDLIECCSLQNAPNTGIGRGFKVSKEQIVGLIVALQNYAKRDHQREFELWDAKIQYMLDELKDMPHIIAHYIYPDETGLPVPRVKLVLDEQALGKTAVDIIQILRAGDPGIVLRPFHQHEGIIILDAMLLKDGEEKIVVDRLKAVLTK